MKVPKMYKSSDRYNAGTDVIYNDDSKLQYAPFIYATTQSGDNGGDGGDGGDDEEGEDTMVVTFDQRTGTIDKSFKALKEAVDAGKIVMLKDVGLDDETGFKAEYYYLILLDNSNVGVYDAYFATVSPDPEGNELVVWQFEATSETDNMAEYQPG